MTSEWKKAVTPEQAAQADPLSEFAGKPMISVGGPNSTFVGRVILELWETPGGSDSKQLAVGVHSIGGDSDALLKRVAAALPARVESITSRQRSRG